MRIILYNDYKKIVGGTEVYQNLLANSLRDRGHAVLEVFGTEDSFPSSISRFKKQIITNSLKIDVELQKAISSHVLEFQPDIVHINNNKIFTKTVLTTFQSLDIPVISSFHDFHFLYKKHHFFNPKRWWKKILFNMVNRKSTALFSLTQIIETELEGHSGKNIHYLPLFVNHKDWTFKADCHFNAPRVVFFGRIEEAKGVFVLWEAFRRVVEEIENCELIYIGEGTESGQLHSKINNSHLTQQVKCLGRLTQPDLLTELHKSCVSVVPTISEEPFGLTGIEAQSAGLPVVASRVGGIPEWCLDGTTGLLIEAGDEKELAKAIIKLIKDKELAQKIAMSAKKRCKEVFDKDIIIRKTERMYSEVIQEWKAN